MTTRRAPDPLKTTVSGLWKIGGIVGGLLAAAYGAVVAWHGLGLWVPAGVELVDNHIQMAVKPVAAKQDSQGVSILNGRLETLKVSKQIALDQQSRLDIQSHTTTDKVASQIIQSQKLAVSDTLKEIDAQITNVSTELNQAQSRK